MASRCTKRVRQLEQAVAVQPLRAELVQEAFERFRETGELPEVERVAIAVLRKALEQREESDPDAEPVDLLAGIKRLVEIVDQIEAGTLPEPRPDEIRRQLYDEAVCDEECVRLAAREALQSLATRGRDVTRPLYLDEEIGIPEYGTVGLHVLGWPECLVAPPYEKQARRLLDRFARLRKRVDPDDQAWFRSLAEAVRRFLTRRRAS